MEVKRIANELSRLPTREEVERLSKYPIDLYDKYFVSWGEVCAAARTTGMSEVRSPQSFKQTEEANQLDLELPTNQ